MESPLGHFTRHQLEMDCGKPTCRRARRYAMSDLAGVYGRDTLLSQVVRRLRKPAMVRVPLKGPEAKD